MIPIKANPTLNSPEKEHFEKIEGKCYTELQQKCSNVNSSITYGKQSTCISFL